MKILTLISTRILLALVLFLAQKMSWAVFDQDWQQNDVMNEINSKIAFDKEATGRAGAFVEGLQDDMANISVDGDGHLPVYILTEEGMEHLPHINLRSSGDNADFRYVKYKHEDLFTSDEPPVSNANADIINAKWSAWKEGHDIDFFNGNLIPAFYNEQDTIYYLQINKEEELVGVSVYTIQRDEFGNTAKSAAMMVDPTVSGNKLASRLTRQGTYDLIKNEGIDLTYVDDIRSPAISHIVTKNGFQRFDLEGAFPAKDGKLKYIGSSNGKYKITGENYELHGEDPYDSDDSDDPDDAVDRITRRADKPLEINPNWDDQCANKIIGIDINAVNLKSVA